MFEEEYEIQKLIGEGSFAKVYKCLEKESGNIYAAKELQIGKEVSDMEAIREGNGSTLCRRGGGMGGKKILLLRTA